MTVWQRILRYLVLWGILFVVLCVISVVRYWDELVAIASGAFDSYVSAIISIGFVVGLVVWGIRLMFRSIS